MQEANLAAQHLHRVALPAAAHLHAPQVVGVAGAVLSQRRERSAVMM